MTSYNPLATYRLFKIIQLRATQEGHAIDLNEKLVNAAHAYQVQPQQEKKKTLDEALATQNTAWCGPLKEGNDVAKQAVLKSLYQRYQPSTFRRLLRVLLALTVAMALTTFLFLTGSILLTAFSSPLSTMAVAGMSLQSFVAWMAGVPGLELLVTTPTAVLFGLAGISGLTVLLAWYSVFSPDHITRLWQLPSYLHLVAPVEYERRSWSKRFKWLLYSEADLGRSAHAVRRNTASNPLRWVTSLLRLMHYSVHTVLPAALAPVLNGLFSLILIPLEVLSLPLDGLLYYGIYQSLSWVAGKLWGSENKLKKEPKKESQEELKDEEPEVTADLAEEELATIKTLCLYYHGLEERATPSAAQWIEFFKLLGVDVQAVAEATATEETEQVFNAEMHVPLYGKQALANIQSNMPAEASQTLNIYQQWIQYKAFQAIASHLTQQIAPNYSLAAYEAFLKGEVSGYCGEDYDPSLNIVFQAWSLKNPNEDLPTELSMKQLHQLKQQDFSQIHFDIACKTRAFQFAQKVGPVFNKVGPEYVSTCCNAFQLNVEEKTTVGYAKALLTHVLVMPEGRTSVDQCTAIEILHAEQKQGMVVDAKSSLRMIPNGQISGAGIPSGLNPGLSMLQKMNNFNQLPPEQQAQALSQQNPNNRYKGGGSAFTGRS